MNIFKLRHEIMDDYESYINSFINIHDADIREKVESELNSGKRPRPLHHQPRRQKRSLKTPPAPEPQNLRRRSSRRPSRQEKEKICELRKKENNKEITRKQQPANL